MDSASHCNPDLYALPDRDVHSHAHASAYQHAYVDTFSNGNARPDTNSNPDSVADRDARSD